MDNKQEIALNLLILQWMEIAKENLKARNKSYIRHGVKADNR